MLLRTHRRRHEIHGSSVRVNRKQRAQTLEESMRLDVRKEDAAGGVTELQDEVDGDWTRAIDACNRLLELRQTLMPKAAAPLEVLVELCGDKDTLKLRNKPRTLKPAIWRWPRGSLRA